jgi:hypothetical protein
VVEECKEVRAGVHGVNDDMAIAVTDDDDTFDHGGCAVRTDECIARRVANTQSPTTPSAMPSTMLSLNSTSMPTKIAEAMLAVQLALRRSESSIQKGGWP